VADVWTRYVLGAPATLLASAGMIAQHRVFRQAGLLRFGRASLAAAAAFPLYGLAANVFPQSSPLPPSTIVNQSLFLRLFHFPVQMLAAAAAAAVAVSVMRFLRSFGAETERQITGLQAARLLEAERRDAWRGELLRRVVEAQEAERERIARELHDETGQALTAIGLGLRGAAESLPSGAAKAAHNLRQLENLVSTSLTELQRLIADLRPSHLDDLGLPAALRWYGAEVQQRTSLRVTVEIAGEPRPIPAAAMTTLFRVAQEALTNTVKHAQAASARVRLSFGEKAVTLRIEDDGQGFDPVGMASSVHPTWGLLGMHERASLLGGRFTLRSRPGEGTQVEVNIPYEAEAAPNGHTPAPGR
jgi:signal transduction histidine kinase